MDKNNPPQKRWLKYALDDLSWTKSNLNEEIWFGACFTAQQAVEKALKAYLISKGKVIKKVHDLRGLLEECTRIDPSFENLKEKCSTLNTYYAPTRYPDLGEYVDFSKDKAHESYAFAKEIVEFVEAKLETIH